MASPTYPVAVVADKAPFRTKASNYPEPFASQMAGRRKQPLGDLFGLANFGVNLTRLAPGAVSALRHAHTRQDEFVYILQGHPTLHTDEGREQLSPGMCAGFKAGSGNGHRLINETAHEVVYLEVGDRTPGDEGRYPDDDLKAVQVQGKWQFVHKDGAPYESTPCHNVLQLALGIERANPEAYPMTHRTRKRASRLLACAVFSLLGICGVHAASTQGPPLPSAAEVFVVTFEPTRYPNTESPYFSADELIRSLATFQPIDDPHDARPLDMYQKGVVVLKNKTVLFWLACSRDYFIVKKQDGTLWFYGRQK